MADRLGCERTEELIPELATGVAAADERAPALGHLARCVRCRGSLESAAATADALLLLAPAREPSPGFETRVLTGVAGAVGSSATADPGRPPPPGRRVRRAHRARLSRSPRTALVRVAAAAALAVLAGGLVWSRTGDDRRLANDYRATLAIAHGRYLRAARLAGPGSAPAGHMVAYEGEPSWILVIVRTGDVSADYAVRLRTHDGRPISLGTMTVTNGYGSWGTTIAIPVDMVAAVTLTSAHAPPMAARLG